MSRRPTLREIVYERAEGRSDLTGLPLGDRWECHHRRPGGQGGTTAPDQDLPSNAVALRPGEHNMRPDSVHLAPEWAKEIGMLLPRGQGRLSVPSLVPIMWRGRAWMWLLPDGTMLPA